MRGRASMRAASARASIQWATRTSEARRQGEMKSTKLSRPFVARELMSLDDDPHTFCKTNTSNKRALFIAAPLAAFHASGRKRLDLDYSKSVHTAWGMISS